MEKLNIIQPRSAVSFILKKGQYLKVVDVEGEAVPAVLCHLAQVNILAAPGAGGL